MAWADEEEPFFTQEESEYFHVVVTTEYAHKLQDICDRFPGTRDPDRDAELTEKYHVPIKAWKFTEEEKQGTIQAEHDLAIEMGNDPRIPEEIEYIWGTKIIRNGNDEGWESYLDGKREYLEHYRHPEIYDEYIFRNTDK